MKINSPFQKSSVKTAVLLLGIPLMLLSCGKSEEKSVEEVIEEGNLPEIRSKKAELSKQQSELTAKIDQLDEAINNLDQNKRLNLITTQVIEDSLFKHYAQVQGDVATDENIIIFPEFSGILSEVRVEEGQNVTRGQTLAIIDEGGLSSELAQLEAQAALARTTFERQERLWEQNIGSEIQYLEAKTNFEALQNSVEQLNSQLAKTVIKAPFSGIIDEVLTEEGEVVNPGQNQLFRLVSLKNMYVEAAVPESYLTQIEKGSDVKVEINSIGREYEGVISQVGTTINPNNRTFRVKVSIPNEDEIIKPNQIATIMINDYTAENAIVIPESTIQKNALGESFVYVLESETEEDTGIAKRVNVETGYVSGDYIEITSGLQPGQTLIVEGAKNLRDEQEVRIEKENNND